MNSPPFYPVTGREQSERLALDQADPRDLAGSAVEDHEAALGIGDDGGRIGGRTGAAHDAAESSVMDADVMRPRTIACMMISVFWGLFTEYRDGRIT